MKIIMYYLIETGEQIDTAAPEALRRLYSPSVDMEDHESPYEREGGAKNPHRHSRWFDELVD